ncbi:hypothetical protein [Rhizobium azibense]|uniref:hypothetical protein n=1 Tax=Rhizobium azibense TaxID=1136135 RepID=UPI001049B3D8|nr:hypothetical protein [Rhizobium azibense]
MPAAVVTQVSGDDGLSIRMVTTSHHFVKSVFDQNQDHKRSQTALRCQIDGVWLTRSKSLKNRRYLNTQYAPVATKAAAESTGIAATYFHTTSLNSVSVSMDYVTREVIEVAGCLQQHVWFEYIAPQHLVILEMSRLGYNYHYGPPG